MTATDYISLNDAKRHLNVEASFTQDDAYIRSLIETAVVKVAADTSRPVAALLRPDGTIHPIARAAALLLIGTLYAYRETVYNGSVNELPLGYQSLCHSLREYR